MDGPLDCGRARQLLWPPGRPRLAHPDIVAAKDHVESCSACRVHFAIDDLLADVRAGLKQSLPPLEVRERVFEAVARQRSVESPARRSGRRLAAMVAAVSIVGLTSVGIFSSMVDDSSPERGDAFIEDYMRLAVREEHIETSDAGEVRRFLLRELGKAVEPITAAGFRIAGAEVCLLNGSRGALIRYQTDSGIVTYYLLPRPGVDDLPPMTRATEPRSGTALVTWASDEIEHALVGPLPAETLLRVARDAT